MKLLKLFLVMFFFQKAYCQLIPPPGNYKNAINIEILGHSRAVFSLNYERYFKPISSCISLTGKVGIGIEPGYTASDNERYNQQTTIPIVATLLFGKKYNHIQLGFGHTSIFISGLNDNNTDTAMIYKRYNSVYSFSCGYRFIADRIALQLYPVFLKSNEKSSKIETDFGMCFGFRFN